MEVYARVRRAVQVDGTSVREAAWEFGLSRKTIGKMPLAFSAPLEGWVLPPEFDRLRRQMEVRLGKRGRREYVQVLRWMETFSWPRSARP